MKFPIQTNRDSFSGDAHNNFVALAKARQPMRGNGTNVRSGPFGQSITVPAAGVSRSGATLKMFNVVSVQGDFITCNEGDGSGGFIDVPVYVAKPPNLRASVSEGVVAGYDLIYDWGLDVTGQGLVRTATDTDGNNEIQVIRPQYGDTLTPLGGSPSAVIFAILSKNGTGVPDVDNTGAFWIEVLPARMWVRRYEQ